jgi:hypothetical protein
MQNPACGLDFKGASFEGNVAHSEGGAVAIKDLTARELNFTGCSFSGNKVRFGWGVWWLFWGTSANSSACGSVLCCEQVEGCGKKVSGVGVLERKCLWLHHFWQQGNICRGCWNGLGLEWGVW